MRGAAFFDMDRTLVRVNTGRLYVRWRFRRREAGLRDVARFARWMAQYTVGVIDPEEVTRKAIATLRGTEEERFRREMEQWWQTQVRPEISEDARREVMRCRGEGFEPVILTASTKYAAYPLARELAIEHVLCSELEVDEGRFTGRCEHLCYGPGKVEAAERWAQVHGVDLGRCLFYTDSFSDLPMLERVGHPRIVNPDPRLRWSAARRGWRVQRWR